MIKSKIFLCFCLSFIGGIFIGSSVFISQPAMLGFLIFAIILIGILGRKYLRGNPLVSCKVDKSLVIIGFSLLFLLAGIWRYQTAWSRLDTKDPGNQDISFVGIVFEEPISDESKTKLRLSAKDKDFQGGVLITTSKYPEYEYGDKLKIKGILEIPVVFESFNYKDYLKKEGVCWVMYYPEIQILGSGFGSSIKKASISLKNKLKESLQKAMNMPQSGLMEALLFGEENNISGEWKQKLNLSGTRHIAAVSGMNITIISALLLNFLLSLGFWRHQAFWGCATLILFYILMIGAPASGVRAAIMGILFLAAQHFGRLSSGSRVMIFTLCFMLALNPLLLRFDVGFQLSFLAVMGLLYLQPIFSQIFKRIPDSFQLRYSLSATLAAQVFTFPILIYNFGYVSLVSPITNVLIVPILPYIMTAGFLFVLSGLLWQPLAWILSLSVWPLLSYLTKIVDFFSKIPWASVTFQISWLWLPIFYLISGYVMWRFTKKAKLKFLDY